MKMKTPETLKLITISFSPYSHERAFRDVVRVEYGAFVRLWFFGTDKILGYPQGVVSAICEEDQKAADIRDDRAEKRKSLS